MVELKELSEATPRPVILTGGTFHSNFSVFRVRHVDIVCTASTQSDLLAQTFYDFFALRVATRNIWYCVLALWMRRRLEKARVSKAACD